MARLTLLLALPGASITDRSQFNNMAGSTNDVRLSLVPFQAALLIHQGSVRDKRLVDVLSTLHCQKSQSVLGALFLALTHAIFSSKQAAAPHFKATN